MNDLAHHLERLGLEQYLESFEAEGFDSWETLLDIQESDLESLNVKLGHRRKLQRAIAEFRGISYERLLALPASGGHSDLSKLADGSQGQGASRDGAAVTHVETKRKYRRHPKPDEHAPEKPPSAYVLFSNKVREEVKADNLTFTEIAKLVGDRWQKLDPTEKEPFETQATTLKDAYNSQSAAYKKTQDYKDYVQYLEEFKAKHGHNTETKRPRLGPQASSGGSLTASPDVIENRPMGSSHGRVGSVGSISAASFTGSLPSSAGVTLPNISTAVQKAAVLVPRSVSPPVLHSGKEPRPKGRLSTQSSMSDDSQPRSEPFDSLSRTATLSLNTPPTGTPPLPSYALGSARSEHSGSSESFVWPSRFSQGTQQLAAIDMGPHGSNLALPSPGGNNDSWRERGNDGPRMPHNPGLTPSGSYTASLPIPSMLGSDRAPDLMRSPGQRSLPPLRPPAVGLQLQPGYQTGVLPSGNYFNPAGGVGLSMSPQVHESSTRPPQENEAAVTLAGLAKRPGPNLPSHSVRR